MSRRYETIYRVKRRDNLGDPDYWNVRLEDIDRRVDANEAALTNLDDVAARVEGAAFDRINNVITPIVVETINRVATIANLFSATSATENTLAFGQTVFVVDAGQRETFAHQNYVSITPADTRSAGLLAPVLSYDRTTGALVIDPEVVWGSGTYASWLISASQPADAHVLRKDNPHETTAAQVGAYTQAQVDKIVSDAVAAAVLKLIGNASVNGDTLGELEALIAGLSATVAANAAAATEEAVAMAIALG
jgi:hypothetical protein